VATKGGGVTRGFILGKFMPPHAGHVTLIQAALGLVDRLTILLCALPSDPIPGETRLAWLRALIPTANVILFTEEVPQQPADHPDFWAIWEEIVAGVHPDPIDRVFAGEAYGAELARRVGAFFVPLGGRILGSDQAGVGGLSATAVRERPWDHWPYLPAPVRDHYALTVCLHGVESVGKSTLAEQLARHYRTILVPEYGRAHCEAHGTDCREADLLLIGEAQQASIEAARPWCNRLLIADTDALMTAAWSQMMIGQVPDQLICHRKADLYLMLGTDAPFIDDGTRVYKTPEERAKFDRVARAALKVARVPVADIAGSWDERFAAAVRAIDGLIADKGLSIS
jgi:HTH-type transcriptional repressor of NAD biosynthesis genes